MNVIERRESEEKRNAIHLNFNQGKEKGKGKKGKRGKKGGTLRAQQERCAHCQDLYTEVIFFSYTEITDEPDIR